MSPPATITLTFEDQTRELVLRAEEVSLIDARTGELLTIDQLLQRHTDVDVFYVGEEHDQAAHHELQAAVGRALAREGPLGVGLEMVDWRFQGVLDGYSAGGRSERWLRSELEWDDNWGMDWDLHRALLSLGALDTVSLHALNAPRSFSRRVFSVGLDGLDDAERAQLPADYDFSNDAYRAFLREVLAAHFDDETPEFEETFSRFEQAQLTWDESMAQSISDAIEADPDRRWVVAVGAGHVQHRWGVPHRVTRRIQLTDLTIVCSALGRAEAGVEAEAQELVDERAGDVLCFNLATD